MDRMGGNYFIIIELNNYDMVMLYYDFMYDLII